MKLSSEQIIPPTIDHLRQQGLSGLLVSCVEPNCRHASTVSWHQLYLDGATAFSHIIKLKRFRCQACGSRSVHLMPEWSAYQASGMGRCCQ